MKTTIIIIALLSMFAICNAALSHEVYKDPNHPGKCAISPELILSAGEHKDPDSPCARIICNADGSAEFQTCGVMQPPPACTYGDYIDASRNYPDCCEKKLNC